MNKVVFAVLYVVLDRRSSNVALFVPISLYLLVDAGNHHVVPNIELSLVIQEGLLYVLLQDECSSRPICIPLFPFQTS